MRNKRLLSTLGAITEANGLENLGGITQ